MSEPCDDSTVAAAAATTDPCDEATATVAARAVTDPCDDPTATVAAAAATPTPPCDEDTTVSAAAATAEPCADDIAPAAVAGSKNLDFGICTDPTMKFGGGFDGRAATENSFLPTNSDGKFGGQSSALNPNIIANFICDNLVNTCKAGADALAACQAAKAVVAGLGVRDASVAVKFNAALGF
ncbi:hypothetical protein DFP73DRAFT_563741 [Morchella snyderi]|nr:hypothetical protein DFP73DRAFT_563741 [Morchella snyderi]